MQSSLRRVALAALLACVTFANVYSAIPTNTRFVVIRTPSGKVDTRYLDGNDGTPAIPLLWQTIAAVSVSTGATGSINLRTLYLSEPGSTPATLTTSCTPTLAGGFSTTADGLSWSSTTAYSGLCKTTATRLGFVSISNEYRVEAVAPASSDTTAPTVPTGLSCTSGVGSFTCSWDASSDSYVGEAGSGVSAYDVRLDSTIVASPTASAGLSKQVTLTNIGTLSPTPTCTQSGADWTIVAAGTIDGTSDLAPFCGASIAGDAFATVKVQSVTTAVNNAKFGLWRRDSLNANSRWYACYVICQASGACSVQARRRQTDGASAGSLGTVSVTLPVWLRMPSVGDLNSCEYSSDGNAFSSLSSNWSLPMSATSYLGEVGTATTGASGATASGDLRQLSLNNVGRVSVTVNTLSSGTVTVRARDVATNASAYGAGISVAPTAPPDTTAPTFSVQPSGNANSSQTSINWSCGTATDANGIRGYIPSTCGTTSNCSGSVDQTEQVSASFTQSGLSSGTTYYFRCKAADPSGNISSYSSIANAATAGSAPPAFTAPTISSVNALGQTSLRITHSSIAGADHYLLREATTVAGTYTILTQFDHTALNIDRTGLTSGQTRCYQVAAANADESTIGPWTDPGVCGTTQVTSAAIAWHPGHYAWVHCGWDWRIASQKTCLLNFIDSIANESNVKGILIRQRWAAMEGASKGDYSVGFAIFDEILARAALRGKRVGLAVHPIQFGGYSPSNAGLKEIFPGYIVDGASYGVTPFNVPNQTGVVARLWQGPTTDALSDMSAAYGARYGSNTGNNAYFEWYEPGAESSMNVTLNTDGYTIAALVTQSKRLFAAARTAWPTKGIRWHANFLGNSNGSDLANVMADCATRGCIIGGPDVLPNQTITANRVYKGETSFLANQRPVMPFMAEVQSPELCGKEGTFTPTQLYAWAMSDVSYDSEDSSYFVWYVNTSECALNSPQRWANDPPAGNGTAGIRNFIRTNPTPLLKTTCPSSYTQGCDTSSLYEPPPLQIEDNIIPFPRKSRAPELRMAA